MIMRIPKGPPLPIPPPAPPAPRYHVVRMGGALHVITLDHKAASGACVFRAVHVIPFHRRDDGEDYQRAYDKALRFAKAYDDDRMFEGIADPY